MKELRMLLIMLLTTVLVFTAACQGAAPTAVEEPPAEEPQPTTIEAEPVTLVLYGYETPQGLLEPQLQKFEEMNPNITVDYQVVPYENYLENLQTMVEADAQIDVMLVNGDSFIDIVGLGLLADVTDKVDYFDRFNEELYYDTYYEVSGQRFGVPSGIGYFATPFYNKALFDKFGLEVPKTWPEMKQVADTLNENGVLPWAFPGLFNLAFSQVTHFATDQVSGNDATTLTRETVAGRIPFTDEKWKKIYEAAIQWEQAGVFGDDYWGVDQSAAESAYAAGVAAMTFTGNWSFPAYIETEEADPDNFQFGIMLPPIFDQAPPGVNARAVVFPGNLWGIYAKTAHMDESLLLMDFLSTDENASAWMDFYETNLSLNKNAKYSGEESEFQLTAKKMFDNGFTAPDWIMGITLYTKFQEELTKTIRGDQTVEEGLSAVEAYRQEIADTLPKY